MQCWFCGGELVWQSDFDYEDYGLDGDGIVSVLYCRECESIWEGYKDLEKDSNK